MYRLACDLQAAGLANRLLSASMQRAPASIIRCREPHIRQYDRMAER